jgi:hypothetical protein
MRIQEKNNVEIYKQQKSNLISTIDNLDIEVESHDLTTLERDELFQAWDQLAKLLREEEIKYYQRTKVIDVLLGKWEAQEKENFLLGP